MRISAKVSKLVTRSNRGESQPHSFIASKKSNSHGAQAKTTKSGAKERASTASRWSDNRFIARVMSLIIVVLVVAVGFTYSASRQAASAEGQVLGSQSTNDQKADQSNDEQAKKATDKKATEDKKAAQKQADEEAAKQSAQQQTTAQQQATDAQPASAAAEPAADPAPVAQPSAPASPYPSGSVGQTKNTNDATRQLLSQMGISEDWLWNRGIKVLPYNGPVQKRCALTTSTSVAGLAVKSNATYPSCPDGQEVIYPEYRTAGKCTVIYDWTNYGLGRTATGNSFAVLAHEIAHCLHFLYGEGSAFQQSYLTSVRPEIAGLGLGAQREIIADDFMICRMSADTNWGHGYYDSYAVADLTAAKCSKAKQLFATYFGI